MQSQRLQLVQFAAKTVYVNVYEDNGGSVWGGVYDTPEEAETNATGNERNVAVPVQLSASAVPQRVQVEMPNHLAYDSNAVRAAIQSGLRQVIGGQPDTVNLRAFEAWANDGTPISEFKP